MPTIKCWQNLGSTMDKTKDMIPKECRFGYTCFTSLATIGGNLYTINPNNLNRVHKDSKDILLVIIILGPKYVDVSMLGHGCGVSQYPQFYDTIK